MANYVIAVKRGKRNDVPVNWLEQLQDIPGVELQGTPTPERAQIVAGTDALQEVQQTIGEFCHIEPVILHDRSEK